MIIKGIAYAWQKLGKISVPKMRYIAAQMNEKFGNDWQMEFRIKEEE